MILKKSSSEDYLENYKKFGKDFPIIDKIKSGEYLYYQVFNNSDYVTDFVIDTNNNSINANISDHLFKLNIVDILNLLKDSYKEISIEQDTKTYGTELFDKLKNNYKVISEEENVYGDSEYPMNRLTIEL